jgi:hypothetical protein
MAVRLSALRAGRPLPPGRFLVLISVRGCVDPKAIVRLEGLGQWINSMTLTGIEPAISRLVDILHCMMLKSVRVISPCTDYPGFPFVRRY